MIDACVGEGKGEHGLKKQPVPFFFLPAFALLRGRLSGVPVITTTGMSGRMERILLAISSPVISSIMRSVRTGDEIARVLDEGLDGLPAGLLYRHLIVHLGK
jgi:hypothetical protein